MGIQTAFSQPSLASPPKDTIRSFFQRIAPHYDNINTLLSFGLDGNWRKKSVRLILNGREETLLDLGVGTGKFMECFLQAKVWQRAVGADFAEAMLRRAQQTLPSSCDLVQTDIHDLPFESESFDLVTASFTLRSIKDLPHFFEEVKRVLRPGGRAAFLCLTRPSSIAMRMLYAPYLKIYLPLLGAVLSSDPHAYRFLSDSIQTFPSPHEIKNKLEHQGFLNISLHPFTFGIATLMMAQK